MGGHILTNPIGHVNSNLVSVIASFDSEGHLKPLYVRVGEQSLKIHSCWLKPSFPGTIEYNCKVIDHDYLKPLSLTYHKNDCVWSIPKIVEYYP